MRTFNQLPLSHWALILCGEESDTRFLVFSNFETESYYIFMRETSLLKQTFKHIKKRFLCCKQLAPRNQFAKPTLSLVESFTGHYITDQKSSLPSIFNSNLQLPHACMEMEGKLPIISNSKEKCYQLIFFIDHYLFKNLCCDWFSFFANLKEWEVLLAITFSAHLWISDICSQKLRVLQDGELRFRNYTELSYLKVSSGVLHNRASF